MPLVGAGNKPNYIWNYNLFILSTQHVQTWQTHVTSLYSLIRDFEKSQNKCKWFNIWSNFLLWWHIFVPNWLVSRMWIRLLSQIEYIYIYLYLFHFISFFLVLYLKTMSLSTLKVIEKSPFTKYSDWRNAIIILEQKNC